MIIDWSLQHNFQQSFFTFPGINKWEEKKNQLIVEGSRIANRWLTMGTAVSVIRSYQRHVVTCDISRSRHDDDIDPDCYANSPTSVTYCSCQQQQTANYHFFRSSFHPLSAEFRTKRSDNTNNVLPITNTVSSFNLFYLFFNYIWYFWAAKNKTCHYQFILHRRFSSLW